MDRELHDLPETMRWSVLAVLTAALFFTIVGGIVHSDVAAARDKTDEMPALAEQPDYKVPWR